jgi:hypothetical protein
MTFSFQPGDVTVFHRTPSIVRKTFPLQAGDADKLVRWFDEQTARDVADLVDSSAELRAFFKDVFYQTTRPLRSRESLPFSEIQAAFRKGGKLSATKYRARQNELQALLSWMLSNVGLPVTGERYVDEMYEDESVDLDDLSEMLFRSNFGFEMTALAASIPKASTQGEIRQYLDQACRDFRMSVYRTSITTSRLADLKLMVREFYSRNGNMRPAVLTDLVREVALNAQFMSFAMNANYAPALPTEPEMRRALKCSIR